MRAMRSKRESGAMPEQPPLLYVIRRYDQAIGAQAPRRACRRESVITSQETCRSVLKVSQLGERCAADQALCLLCAAAGRILLYAPDKKYVGRF